MAGRQGRIAVAESSRRPLRYLPYPAALAASALSLVPGAAGAVLLAASAGVAVHQLLDRSGKLGRVRLPSVLVPADRLGLLRFFVAGCQALTIAISWPVWQSREYPPPLPAFTMPQADFGLLVIASIVLVLIVPRVGIWVHLGALLVAFTADQTRLQPTFVSMAVILAATCLPGIGRYLGRAHLVTMYVWAGMHKVLSIDFMTDSAYWIYEGLPVRIEALKPHVGWFIAGSELATGLLMLVHPIRKAGIVLALGLHGMILLVLSPSGQDWNQSVWPWNFALGVSAAVLFWPGTKAVPQEAPWRRGVGVRIAIGAVAALYPLGFYLGLTDAYLAHHLYSDATASAVCGPPVCVAAKYSDTWTAFDVYIPPEPRLFKQYFFTQCKPGQSLTVFPRKTKILFGHNSQVATYRCPVRET